MELLIPGLILVALMAYASTKIKKRAAEAFEPELIETDAYRIQKPEGFLHVINSPDHDFEAYSKEFDEGDFRIRRAKIEVDVFRDNDMQGVVKLIRQNASRTEITSETGTVTMVEADEAANEISLNAVYKIVAGAEAIYRLRFAVINRHRDDYSDKIDDTLESFALKSS